MRSFKMLWSTIKYAFFSHSLLSDIPHNVDEPIAQTPVPFIDKMMVSEADVTMVADDVVTTVFDKLYTAAKTETIASENSYKTIIATQQMFLSMNTPMEEENLPSLHWTRIRILFSPDSILTDRLKET